MGVQGLTPFLQKACPEVIRELPNRLHSLAGKTIAIDGTLITQRLHFARLPHDKRHVLGWYKVLSELKDSGLKVICVFDGKERGAAKQREVERRRAGRALHSARGTMEAERLARLRQLKSVVQRFSCMPLSEQALASSTLKALLPEVLSSFSIPSSAKVTRHGTRPSSPVLTEGELDRLARLERSGRGASESLRRDIGLSLGWSEVTTPPADVVLSTANRFLFAAPGSSPNTSTNLDLPTTPQSRDVSIPISETSHVLRELENLHASYRQSVPALDPAVPIPKTSTTNHMQDADMEDGPVAIVMTPTQHQLTLDEGDFWAKLFDIASLSETEINLANLATRSDLLHQSYHARSSPPTDETYEESKMIIRAMGIPIIQSVAPYEAEALAASLVVNGHADFVASEDTDVLLYEAPLLRNITNRRMPLMLISGVEIREALKLTRASFIDFALLLGTDFSQRIKGIGPHRAIELIRSCGSIEDLLRTHPKVRDRLEPRMSLDEYMDQVSVARVIFGSLPPVPSIAALENVIPDEAKVEGVLDLFGLTQLADDYDEMALQTDFFATRSHSSSTALGDNVFGDVPHL